MPPIFPEEEIKSLNRHCALCFTFDHYFHPVDHSHAPSGSSQHTLWIITTYPMDHHNTLYGSSQHTLKIITTNPIDHQNTPYGSSLQTPWIITQHL